MIMANIIIIINCCRCGPAGAGARPPGAFAKASRGVTRPPQTLAKPAGRVLICAGMKV